MTSFPVLSLTVFLPLLGVLLLLLFVRNDDADESQVRAARWIAFATSLLTFAASVWMFTLFDPADTDFQLEEKIAWIPAFKISYHLGVDAISAWFILLTGLLTPLSILAGFATAKRVKFFMVALLALETMMLGTFAALDFVLFYVFFEGVLIPMFLLIGIWGGEGRLYASYKFFLYTFLGSVLMLAAIFAMAAHAGTTDMTEMMGNLFPRDMALWLWLGFFASFAVKTPMWPFHTWLPFAHVEAPTAGSVILAGVLLKMGGYGFIRISLQMLPEASAFFAPVVIGLSLIAILYASLVALAQTDLKKLVAYSSVAHMGYVTLGLFSFNQQGIDGAMFVMLSHGLVSAALFLCVGVLYERLHTREIKRFGGLATPMPRYATFFMVFMLASIGLPGTSGFVGEFLSLQGAYLANSTAAVIASFGLVFGATYMLWLYRRLFFGVPNAENAALPDLNWREWTCLLPLLILILTIGLQPKLITHSLAPATQMIFKSLQAVIGGHV